MMIRSLTHWFSLRIVIAALLVSNGFASDKEVRQRLSVYRGSIFIPVSRSFNGLAKAAGVEGHNRSSVRGKNGAPGFMGP